MKEGRPFGLGAKKEKKPAGAARLLALGKGEFDPTRGAHEVYIFLEKGP